MLMFTPTTVGGSFLSACNNVLAAADPRSEPISPERTYGARVDRTSEVRRTVPKEPNLKKKRIRIEHPSSGPRDRDITTMPQLYAFGRRWRVSTARLCTTTSLSPPLSLTRYDNPLSPYPSPGPDPTRGLRALRFDARGHRRAGVYRLRDGHVQLQLLGGSARQSRHLFHARAEPRGHRPRRHIDRERLARWASGGAQAAQDQVSDLLAPLSVRAHARRFDLVDGADLPAEHHVDVLSG